MGIIRSQYPGKCRVCGNPYAIGDRVYWKRGVKGASHESCFNRPVPALDRPTPAKPATAKADAKLQWTLDFSELKAITEEAIKTGIYPISPNSKNSHNTFTSCVKPTSWHGYTQGQLIEWLRDGYSAPGLTIGDFTPPLREKRRIRFAEDGDEFHLDRAYSGFDEYMSEWTKREAIPGCLFEAEITFSATTSSAVIAAYNAWLCRAVYALEAAGIDAEVRVNFTSSGVFEKARGVKTTSVRVKRENETTDFRGWSAMLSPAALRTFGFLCDVLHAEHLNSDTTYGLGSGHGKQWVVSADAETRTISVECPYSGASFFPEEQMTNQLREALETIKGN